MAKTFVEFYNQLRRRLESTGRTDSHCGSLDDFRRHRLTHVYDQVNSEDEGWVQYGSQELAKENFNEFLREMITVSAQRIMHEVNSTRDPSWCGLWQLNAAFEFYHTAFDEANRCGLKADAFMGWEKFRDAIETIPASTRR